MFVYLDTEFTGIDQINPRLISVGLVSERGDWFYAELPRAEYIEHCSPWVIDNVLLWGGQHELPTLEFAARLGSWIDEINGPVTLVCSAKDYDFELIKPLLDPWPVNLARQAIQFDCFSLGPDRQDWLVSIIGSYFNEARPEHHALNDAFALRLGGMAALEAGWAPQAAQTDRWGAK